MGNKKIDILPAKGEMVKQEKRKRVAAYCRVSTSMAEQEGSFETQKQYYESCIGRKPGWELAGIRRQRHQRHSYEKPSRLPADDFRL